MVITSKLAVRWKGKRYSGNELDEVAVSIPTEERVVIRADFSGHVGEANR